jgi:hypothetical protein
MGKRVRVRGTWGGLKCERDRERADEREGGREGEKWGME